MFSPHTHTHTHSAKKIVNLFLIFIKSHSFIRLFDQVVSFLKNSDSFILHSVHTPLLSATATAAAAVSLYLIHAISISDLTEKHM